MQTNHKEKMCANNFLLLLLLLFLCKINASQQVPCQRQICHKSPYFFNIYLGATWGQKTTF